MGTTAQEILCLKKSWELVDRMHLRIRVYARYIPRNNHLIWSINHVIIHQETLSTIEHSPPTRFNYPFPDAYVHPIDHPMVSIDFCTFVFPC